MDTSQQTINKLPLVILTYNMDKNANTAGIFRLIETHQPDILALQEVNQKYCDEHSVPHNAFKNNLARRGYIIHLSSTNITILKTSTLGPYIAHSSSSTDGRILITPLTLTHSFTLFIINTYGCQQSHPDVIQINTNIINYLSTFVDTHGYTNCHYIPVGDINIDPDKHGRTPANLHHFFLNTLQTLSTFRHLQYLRISANGSLPELPPTYVDENGGSSCLDHVCVPFALIPDDIKDNSEFQPEKLKKVYNASPHHPVLQRLIVPFLDFAHIPDTDVPPPIFRTLSSIPLMSGPDPTDPENPKGWFQPDDTIIPPSKLDAKQALITKAHSVQTSDPELQRLQRET